MRRLWAILVCTAAASIGQAQEHSISIGVVLPLSGPTSNYGTEALRGINLATEQINAAGGVRERKLNLIVRDNAGNAATTAEVAAELVNQKQVLALVGPITSTDAAAAGTVAQQARTPIVLPVATSPYVTEIGEYVCRICFTDPLQSKALAMFSRKHLRADRVAVIYQKGSSYSEKLAEFYTSQFRDIGGVVVFSAGFTLDSFGPNELVRQAVKTNPDLIFAPVYYPEAASIINELAAVKSSLTVLGGDGWESPELFRLTGSNLHSGHVYISSHFSLELQKGSQFVGQFRHVYGEPPNAVSALGYDAVMVLADALRRATTITRDGVQQALVSTDRYRGVTGMISINEKRDVLKDVHFLKAVDNRFIHEDVISPF
ncbi:MAG: ABC transporter substrate-binding protein [candidate division Zixibacteria bacterium]|nr:ABC transporter substrate-binding protein [candidate division Zixibacteria bacterium]